MGRKFEDQERPISGASSTQDGRVTFTRRGFLKASALSSGAAGFSLAGCDPTLPPIDFGLNILRAEDFVVLHVDFVGLERNADGDQIVPKGTGARYVIVTHPSQHLHEEAFLETPGDPPVDHADPGPTSPVAPVGARLSGASRVVFKVPDDFVSLPYALGPLLEWLSTLEMNLSPNATPRDNTPVLVVPIGPLLPTTGAPGVLSPRDVILAKRKLRGQRALEQSIGRLPDGTSVEVTPAGPVVTVPLRSRPPVEPTSLETAIEAPYRLLISPNKYGAWAHAPQPVEFGGRVELWHSRLGVRATDGAVDEKSSDQRTIRAIWTRDEFNPVPPDQTTAVDPFQVASVLGSDRIQLVHNTADFSGNVPKPQPVDVNRLMLTGLGTWFDVNGSWPTPAINLESWDHRATHGRDHYVRLIYQGFLYPWGHRASLVVVTERKFIEGHEHTAFLWQKVFVIVREPLKTYWSSTLPDVPSHLRQMPFNQVLIKQLVTPDLYPADNDGQEIHDARVGTDTLTMLVAEGEPFRFPMEAIDRDGRLIRFNANAVWVPSNAGAINWGPGGISGGISNPRGKLTQNTSLQGQRVSFALSQAIDDTTYEVESIDFTDIDDGSGVDKPGFVPAVQNAHLLVEAVRQLAGSATSNSFKYAQAYLEHGYADGSGQNPGALLFELDAPDPVEMSFRKKTDQSGGFISPSMDISGLSRKTGPVAGPLADIAANAPDPNQLFSSINAWMFGAFKLGDIIAAIGLDEAPKFITQTLDTIENFLLEIEKARAAAQKLIDQATGLVDDITELAAAVGELQTIVPAITTAIGSLVEDGDAQPIIDDLINPLYSQLGVIETKLEELDPTIASGVRSQLIPLVKSIRSVIETDLKPPIEAFAKALELAKNLTVRLEWSPPIKGDSFGFFEPSTDAAKPGRLLLAVEVRGKDLPGKPAGVDLLASLENFKINLLGDEAKFMVLPFQRVQFKVTSNKKPEIDVVFDDIIFDGILAFVNTLSEIIPLSGFSDPPAVSVSLEGIEASFSMPLPSIAVGMFSLENLSLGAGFKIPFIGPPVTVTFYFCTREEPFVLTVSMLGGGGFFGITVSPQGVEILEAALEFGASLSIDFGVASGGISIMAGIYFKMEQDEATLTGYLRMRGEVDVLGLISASITLYMEIEYQFSSKKCIGRASIEIEVSVLCFSATVTIEAERKFSGSNDDPTFEQLMGPIGDYNPWDEYVAAFAA